MKLMYITNDEKLAAIADQNNVDWIFIDLELLGKEARQGHLDTVISRHKLSDVYKVKRHLTKSKLLVRINPINENSKEEIESVLEAGAEIIMLPYFKSKKEVNEFLTFVNKRAEVCLLLETSEAVDNLDDILSLQGIDYIHIGLNDLHISYKLNFMFELVTNGMIEYISQKIKKKSIPFGFGGISKLGHGMLPAEKLLIEHHRLGSEMIILSRSFYNHNTEALDELKVNELFNHEIKKIRSYEQEIKLFNLEKIETNKKEIEIIVENIVNPAIRL